MTMDDKKLRGKNLALRILIFITTYMGVSSVRDFFDIRMAVGFRDDYTIFSMAAGYAVDYLTFLILAIVVFVMNFVARKSVSKKELIFRSVILGFAVILIWQSAPSVSYISYMGASRYTDITTVYPIDIGYVTEYISTNLWTVFSYMVSAAAYVVLTVISILSIVKNRRRE